VGQQSEQITTALLRERLAGTRLPADLTDVTMPPGSENWPADMRKALSESLQPAGVLIPVIERGNSLTVLLTRRSAELKHHAGQISFPGGRMEAHDPDIRATALRETHEEVGIAPDKVAVIGYLEPMPTVTGYAVTPVIGVIERPDALTIDHREVELAFEVPLAFLLDKRNARAGEREFRGRKVAIIEFIYEQHRIWGATAYMLVELREKLIKNKKI
jgi:8-oxo-dGTP pyrophosphatase MutT (NUDIX family)